ncbi:MAG TPA: DNA polymerase III subunit epsilon [Microscillaceae bacterium]|jgi:DNA polymerase-3 subunit epsilon|nr:DNA polymerase III subunit epsilon [Microscillaceae bacterium]
MVAQQFAVVDIETTGGRPNEDRIIEIGIVIHNGKDTVEEFHSLINPERNLPEFIVKLTGIQPEILDDAPKFYEIAKKIVEITENRIFVAHNAHFDYNFLKAEFKRLGYVYRRKTLCTLRLARKIIPKEQVGSGYGLRKVCDALQIPLTDHHRALADAQAAAGILAYAMQKDFEKASKQIVTDEISLKALPPKISLSQFEQLPEQIGVYYLLDEEDRIVYVGKSKNIKKRIASHFGANLESRKSVEFKNRIANIDYVLTGSELIALLLESHEIKTLKPLFNRAQRRTGYSYGIFERKTRAGYLTFFVDKLANQTKTPVKVASNAIGARAMLQQIAKKYGLCMKLCGLYESKGACFDHHVGLCQGACIEAEAPETYNLKTKAALQELSDYHARTFCILTQGRNHQEHAVVCVEKGKYLGFGYVDKEQAIHSFEEAKQHITLYQDNKDVQKIIFGWLKREKSKVIYSD